MPKPSVTRIDFSAFEVGSYQKWPQFAALYLEDSYVLAISVSSDIIDFRLLTVLLEGHPCYEPPRAGEHACYKEATLRFSGVTVADWDRTNAPPSVDPDGSTDLGNIDFFTFEEGRFFLGGDWGEVHIGAKSLVLSVGA